MNQARFYRFTIVLLLVTLTSVLLWPTHLQHSQQAQIQTLQNQLAAEQKARRDNQQVAVSALKRLGVRISTWKNGTSWALVGSLPLDKWMIADSYLREHHIFIAPFTSTVGLCGVEVMVLDFDKAVRLLQQIRPQLVEGMGTRNRKSVWIWGDKRP